MFTFGLVLFFVWLETKNNKYSIFLSVWICLLFDLILFHHGFLT